jgi:hypothetical protein
MARESAKSWQNFMDSFITIRRRDETAVPLLAPNQDIYLRENIRSRLLVAAQAVLAIRKRPTSRRWITSLPGFAPTTIRMIPPPKRFLRKLTS